MPRYQGTVLVPDYVTELYAGCIPVHRLRGSCRFMQRFHSSLSGRQALQDSVESCCGVAKEDGQGGAVERTCDDWVEAGKLFFQGLP